MLRCFRAMWPYYAAFQVWGGGEFLKGHFLDCIIAVLIYPFQGQTSEDWYSRTAIYAKESGDWYSDWGVGYSPKVCLKHMISLKDDEGVLLEGEQ